MEIEFIDTKLLTQGRLEVNIVRAASPLLFWVQLKNSEKDLQEMEEELAFRMVRRAQHLHCFPDTFYNNMNVAIRDFNSWHRGLVKRIDRTTQMVQIILGDWARIIWRPMNEVFILEDRFRELQWQAIPCGLAYTTPVQNTSVWQTETRHLCRILIEGHKGWMNIVHPFRKNAALVKLHAYAKYNNTGYNLRDTLIRLGHAKLHDKISADVAPNMQGSLPPSFPSPFGSRHNRRDLDHYAYSTID